MKRSHILLSAIMMILTKQVGAQDGLVAYWSFDELSGDTIYDHSPLANHGINYGAELIQGKKGNALWFDGVSDYARIPEDGQAPPAVLADLDFGSISVWFKVEHIPTDYGIAPIFYYGAEDQCDFFDAANQGLIIELGHTPVHYGSERLYFTIWKNGCTLPSFCYDSWHPIPENEWQHFVVVVGEDYNTGYLNGEEMIDRKYNFGNASYSQFFSNAVVHEKLWLGKGYWDRTTQYYKGAIDELRIYDKALSQSEVLALYHDTLTTSIPPLDPKSSRVKVYPNPVRDMLYYDLSELEANIQIIRLLDKTGKTIAREKAVSTRSVIKISQIPDGLYFIDFISKEGYLRKKIIITN